MSIHLSDYVSDLEKRARAGRNGRGAKLLKSRIERLIKECSWGFLFEVTADSFVTWRNQQKLAAKTLNHFLQGMNSFLNWLERIGRIKGNPLKHVSKIDERGQKKRQRRAFTDEELRKLVDGSAGRGIIYFTAARTGLRQEELRQLTWGDIHLDCQQPFILAQAATTKNKKEAHIGLVGELTEKLRSYRPARAASTDRVFPQGIPRASRLKVDAEKN